MVDKGVWGMGWGGCPLGDDTFGSKGFGGGGVKLFGLIRGVGVGVGGPGHFFGARHTQNEAMSTKSTHESSPGWG